MLSSLFQATSIPVLEQVVNFTQARNTVLAGNIANLDTPGYQARDLSVEDFQERLKTAIQSQQSGGAATSPGELAAESATPLAEVAKNSVSMLRHDQGNVNMESQASEMAQNHIQHNLALSLLIDQFHLLQSAISEKV